MTDWTTDQSGMETGDRDPLETDLHALPTEARVPDHLWHGVRSRMDVGNVVDPETQNRSGPRRFSVSAVQLIAAGLVLSLLSGGGVWIALTAGSDPPLVGGPLQSTAGAVVAAAVQPEEAPIGAMQQYEAAIAELEAVLEEGRSVLGDATIRTLEESLITIDRAIAEASSALAQDPGNELLNRLLTRTLLKKMDILKQTAVTIRVRST